jgi:hypothetical protein
LTIGQSLELDPGPGFSVLAASRTSPLVLAWDHAGVKALIVAFDPRASDFPLRPGFPILLANALSWFFPTWLDAQAEQVQAGDTRMISTGNAPGLTVVKPDGRRVTMITSGPAAEFFDTDETGFYRVESGGSATEFAATLSSDAETDISPRFSPPRAASPEKGAQAGIAAPAWVGVAAAALVFMLGEWLAWVWVPGRRRA